jgi:hypothetical protein
MTRLAAIFILLCASAIAGESLTLSWQFPSDQLPEISGFNIYYGPAPSFYTNEISVSREQTNCVISGLSAGQRYYVAMTACNDQGLESGFSEEVSYLVRPARPVIGRQNVTLSLTIYTSTNLNGGFQFLGAKEFSVATYARDCDASSQHFYTVKDSNTNALPVKIELTP